VLAVARGHWQIENGLHYVNGCLLGRVTLGKDRSTIHKGNGPSVMAILRDTVVSVLHRAGWRTIAERLRCSSGDVRTVLDFLGISLMENASALPEGCVLLRSARCGAIPVSSFATPAHTLSSSMPASDAPAVRRIVAVSPARLAMIGGPLAVVGARRAPIVAAAAGRGDACDTIRPTSRRNDCAVRSFYFRAERCRGVCAPRQDKRRGATCSQGGVWQWERTSSRTTSRGARR